MIPRKIELKNFLSYGAASQTIDFKDYRLICFSGKNGNGKSALLDAITWGIWGCARKISGTIKADSGLLRLGQTQMMVSVEFEFNGNIYRVRREFAKTYGRDYQILDLELFDKEKDAFVSLSDKTVKKTQEKIETLLGLDFETFVNSAFLRQGMANEFSQKNPRERKQILINILGLGKYENLKNLAQDKIKVLTSEKEKNQFIIERSNLDISEEPKLKDQLILLQDLLDKKLEEIRKLNIKFESLEKEKSKTLLNLQQLENLKIKINETKQYYDEKLKKYFEMALFWRNVHKKSLVALDIEKIEKEKLALLSLDRKFRQEQHEDLLLQGEMFKFQTQYQEKVNQLKKEKEQQVNEEKLILNKVIFEVENLNFVIKEKLNQKKELEYKILNLKTEHEELENKIKKIGDLEVRYENSLKQFEKRRTFYNIWIQKGNWVKESLVALEQKKKIMSDDKNPSCPLCEQLLTSSRKKYLISDLAIEESFKINRLKRITFLISSLKEILIHQNDELSLQKDIVLQLKEFFSRREVVLKQFMELKSDLKFFDLEIAKLEKNKAEFEKNVLSIKLRIESKEQAVKEVETKDEAVLAILNLMEQVKIKKQSLNINQATFVEISQKLDKLDTLLKESEDLKREIIFQKERRLKLVEFFIELKQLKKTLNSLNKDCEKLKPFEISKNLLEEQLSGLKFEIESFNKDKEKILQDIGSFNTTLKRLELLKIENEENLKKLTFLSKEILDFQKVSAILGKDGVQALLIEEAIPEIEEEANNILSKLSENQAQIFIDSLRDLKKGGVKETLDIKISDSTGIRPYEMFSGGEAFRIDFALRIAISKMLARRAGTALQTLIIDEGFGSQDEDGLARLMDAIYLIQEDFAKVIVVSHLTSFKENFPVHFVVDKLPTGSVVTVVERS